MSKVHMEILDKLKKKYLNTGFTALEMKKICIQHGIIDERTISNYAKVWVLGDIIEFDVNDNAFYFKDTEG
jgi:hypothetical protein